jgi:probable rRNA maturation factor
MLRIGARSVPEGVPPRRQARSCAGRRTAKPAPFAIDIADLQRSLRIDRAGMRRAVRAVLAGADVPRGRISLAVVDDPTMAGLNLQFLRHEGTTDVLSFLLEREEGYLEGEVIVAAETARRQAPRYGWTPHDELLLYVIHGALHLVGYDDATPRARARMRARERAVLAQLGMKA